MRNELVLGAAIALSLAGCDKKPAPARETPRLGDLSTSLDAVRAEFNAHKGEARFLTLLSPT